MMQSRSATPAAGNHQRQINQEEFASLEARIEARFQEVDQMREHSTEEQAIT